MMDDHVDKVCLGALAMGNLGMSRMFATLSYPPSDPLHNLYSQGKKTS